MPRPLCWSLTAQPDDEALRDDPVHTEFVLPGSHWDRRLSAGFALATGGCCADAAHAAQGPR